MTSVQRETGQLWMVNADGSDAHLANDLEIGWGVRWSPDGRWIVGDSNHSLVIFGAADLSAPPRVVKLPGPGSGLPAFGASWPPDGTRLAFSILAKGSQPDIATIATDGTDLWILTSDPAKEEFPDWGLPQ